MGLISSFRSLANRSANVVKSVAQRAVPILSGIYSATAPLAKAVSAVTNNLMNPTADKVGGYVNRGLGIVGATALVGSQLLQQANRGHLYQNIVPG